MIKMYDVNDVEFYVSECDFKLVNKYEWIVFNNKSRNTNYVYMKQRGKLIALHRFIMNPPDDMVVDHIDRNGLNNTRDNLRICSPSSNSLNIKRSNINDDKIRGIFKTKIGWRVLIVYKNEYHYFDSYKTKMDACIIHNRKALEIQGEDALLIEGVVDDGREIKTIREHSRKSKYKNVSPTKSIKNPWMVDINRIYFGAFKTEEEAVEFVRILNIMWNI